MSAQRDREVRQQARLLLQSGQFDDAIALLQEHVSSSRSDHEAQAMLAQVLTMHRRYDEAESLLLRAMRGDRRRADYQALMAELLTTTGRHADALARYDQALKIARDYDAAHAGKAETYLRMGKPDRAIAVLHQAPDTPVTAVPHARAMTRLGQFTQAEALCRAHLPATNAPGDVQRGLWFALGQACMRAEQFDRATAAFTRGNALSAGGWTPDGDRARNDRLMEVFSAEAIGSLPRSECTSDVPVFVVGMLRSGSTLVEQIIDAHPDATGAGELDTLGELAMGMQSRLGTRLPFPDLLGEINEAGLTAIARDYLEALPGGVGHCRRVVDKQLGNFVHLGLVSLLFPSARIIHCRRHPMDLGLSAWTQKLPPGTNAWAADLESIGQAISLADELMAHWQRVLPVPILEVRYENVVADLDSSVRQILEFCDLPFDKRCLRFWESGRTVLTLSSDQVRKPIYDASVGRHVAWGNHLAPLRTALGDAVDQYGSPPTADSAGEQVSRTAGDRRHGEG